MQSARDPSRLDFRQMEFELGLRKTRRVSLPDQPGTWDARLDMPTASQSARIALAKQFRSLQEMAEVNVADDLSIGVKVWCVFGNGFDTEGEAGSVVDGDGVVEADSARSCAHWIWLLNVAEMQPISS